MVPGSPVSLTINESLVVDGHGEDPPNEAEIFQVILVAKSRLWVDLESVVITRDERGDSIP